MFQVKENEAFLCGLPSSRKNMLNRIGKLLHTSGKHSSFQNMVVLSILYTIGQHPKTVTATENRKTAIGAGFHLEVKLKIPSLLEALIFKDANIYGKK